MKSYFLDDRGIDTLVKSIIKKLFESPNYISLRNTISSLRTDLDNISTSSNGVVPCRCAFRGSGRLECSYPPGFNVNNTMIVGTYASSLINGSPGQFGFDYVQFSFTEFYIQLNATSACQPSGDAYVYLMKRPSI